MLHRLNAKNGEVVDINELGILVKCQKGALAIKEVQLEGKKRMSVKEWRARCL